MTKYSSPYFLTNFKLIGFKFEEEYEKNLIISVNEQGKIEELGNTPPTDSSYKKIDLEGAFLSPGWIDMHTHIYYGVAGLSTDPRLIGPKTGVIIPVDVGSAGEDTFTGFKKYIVQKHEFPIKAFLNIGSIGTVGGNRISELRHPSFVDLNKTIKCIHDNQDIIKGVKVRASKVITNTWGIQAIKLAKKVANIFDIPVMVHVGEPPVFIEDVFEVLESGDILTHCFNGKRGNNLYDDSDLLLAYKSAFNKGIRFDLGHGSASFSYDSAKKAFENGVYPFTISTDIYGENIGGPVWDLSTTMSKMMHMGLELTEIIKMVTKNPAEILKLLKWDRLAVNEDVSFTAFKVKEGSFSVLDSNKTDDTSIFIPGEQQKIILDKLIRPCFSFYRDLVYKANSNFEI